MVILYEAYRWLINVSIKEVWYFIRESTSLIRESEWMRKSFLVWGLAKAYNDIFGLENSCCHTSQKHNKDNRTDIVEHEILDLLYI